jgi:hypothetical protein
MEEKEFCPSFCPTPAKAYWVGEESLQKPQQQQYPVFRMEM